MLRRLICNTIAMNFVRHHTYKGLVSSLNSNFKYYSYDLLPQDPASLVRGVGAAARILDLFVNLLNELIDALKIFYLERGLSRFDPHVGETSCQIRAYKTLLYDNLVDDEILCSVMRRISFLENVRSNYMRIYHARLHTCERIKTMTIRDLMRESGLDFEIKSDEMFLMRSWFLTKYKIEDDWFNTHIDCETIAINLNISHKQSKKLAHYFQCELAIDSSLFVQGLLEGMGASDCDETILQFLHKDDDDGRTVMPCFHFSEIIFSHLRENRLPILFVINRRVGESVCDKLCLLCDFAVGGVQLASARVLDSYGNKSALVVHGVADYKQNAKESNHDYLMRFVGLGPENILRMNMAKHPQFSGVKLKMYSENPYLLLREQQLQRYNIMRKLEDRLYLMQYLAEISGCCESHPHLFFVRHIYCDKLVNYIKYT
ncbi:MAG: hypothetical protein KAS93_07455 [Gammaproteobacteria bacterium]|nr:hypothetical protein [Gammaproteobacteria bacterium]